MPNTGPLTERKEVRVYQLKIESRDRKFYKTECLTQRWQKCVENEAEFVGK
jgi:hypothetical protein